MTCYFHFFHFPAMRWPTSPLAADGPVPHRLHDRDTHLLYDLYAPVLYSVCVWGGGGESNRVCLCGVEWEHGPSQCLWEWASLHCGGAVGERVGHPPQGWGKIEGRWPCLSVCMRRGRSRVRYMYGLYLRRGYRHSNVLIFIIFWIFLKL